MEIYKISRLLLIVYFFNMASSFGQEQDKLLSDAYKQKSTSKLNRFFNIWEKDIVPLSKNEFENLNPSFKEAYLVFKEFYNPINLSAIGGSEFGNDIYKNASYFVVQDHLNVYQQKKVYYTSVEEKEFAINQSKIVNVSDSLKNVLQKAIQNAPLGSAILQSYGPNSPTQEFEKPELLGKIDNFRPNVGSLYQKQLILTLKYKTLISKFLGNEYHKSSDNLMSTAKVSGVSKSKLQFIEQKIKIFPSHWGEKWLINTFPEVTSIAFDQSFNYAKIKYTIVYQGGQAILKKENGIWKLVSAELTSIQ